MFYVTAVCTMYSRVLFIIIKGYKQHNYLQKHFRIVIDRGKINLKEILLTFLGQKIRDKN